MHTCDGVTNIINITGQAPAVNIHANYPKSYAEPGCKPVFFNVLPCAWCSKTLMCCGPESEILKDWPMMVKFDGVSTIFQHLPAGFCHRKLPRGRRCRRTLCRKKGFDVAVVRMASRQIHQSHFLSKKNSEARAPMS